MSRTMNRRKRKIAHGPNQPRRTLIPLTHKPIPQLRLPKLLRTLPLKIQRPLHIPHPITHKVVVARVDQHPDALVQQLGDVELVLVEEVARGVECEADFFGVAGEVAEGGVDADDGAGRCVV